MSGPVLVTGGAGFIGSHLVRRLVSEGAHVRVLDLPTAYVDHLPLDHIDLIRGDIRDRPALERAVRGCQAVYHLAANPQLWTQHRGHFHQVNYLGTANVLQAALALGVKRILHTSSESILTRIRQVGPITEDQQVPVREVLGPYCRSKWRAERLAFQLARAGAPIVIVNPTLPVGPGDFGLSPPTRMMLDFCQGRRHEYINACLNLIDVRDVAEGMVRAVEKGRPGVRYLLGHTNLSVQDVFAKLANLTGLPEPRWHVPYPVALVAAYVSEFLADVYTHRVPAATVTGVRLARRTMHFDARRSLQELNLKPRPLTESLTDAVAWFRAVGWMPSSEPKGMPSKWPRKPHFSLLLRKNTIKR